MSENAKKGLIISLIILLLVGIAFLIYWGVTNYEKVQEGLNGTGLYTSTDLENAKKEGYLEGANSLQELEKQLQDLKAQLDTKTKSVTELTNRVTELTNANNELLENKSENEQIIIDKNLEIQSLNEQITLLNNEIIRLNKLLEAYSNYEGQTYTATFYVDDTAVDVKVVDGGTTITQDFIPTKTGDYKYTFEGWSFDKENIIELSNYIVNEDVELYAVFTKENYTISEYTSGHTSKLFTINSTSEWCKFAALVDTGNSFEGITIELATELDFTGIENVPPVGYFYPGGTNSNSRNYYFSGSFDGRLNKISNLTIDGGYILTGIFGQCKNASIKNLFIENVTIVNSINSFAGVLCSNLIDSEVSSIFGDSNLIVTGQTIQTIENGLIGQTSGECKIENCSFYADISEN